MSHASNDYDYYRQFQKMRLWRAIAFSMCIVACFIVAYAYIPSIKSDHIAEISIDGVINDVGKQVKEIDKLAHDDNVKAVIVAINSPGGTTYDSEILFNVLQKVATKKPVISYMKNIAASGGYIVALASEKIYAAKNTITGSIGVIMQIPNGHELMDKIGISLTEIKSSAAKGGPNYFKTTPPEILDNLHDMVEDTNLWFKDLVKQRRKGMTEDIFTKVTDGRVFTGQQAVENKLIDAIGGREEAKKYLIKKYKFKSKIKIIHKKTVIQSRGQLIDYLKNQIVSIFSQYVPNFHKLGTNNVDGLLSLWHS